MWGRVHTRPDIVRASASRNIFITTSIYIYNIYMSKIAFCAAYQYYKVRTWNKLHINALLIHRSAVISGFPSHNKMIRNFDIFFIFILKNMLNRQSRALDLRRHVALGGMVDFPHKVGLMQKVFPCHDHHANQTIYSWSTTALNGSVLGYINGYKASLSSTSAYPGETCCLAHLMDSF